MAEDALPFGMIVATQNGQRFVVLRDGFARFGEPRETPAPASPQPNPYVAALHAIAAALIEVAAAIRGKQDAARDKQLGDKS